MPKLRIQLRERLEPEASEKRSPTIALLTADRGVVCNKNGKREKALLNRVWVGEFGSKRI